MAAAESRRDARHRPGGGSAGGGQCAGPNWDLAPAGGEGFPAARRADSTLRSLAVVRRNLQPEPLPSRCSTPFSVAAGKAGQVAAQGFPARHGQARPGKGEPQEPPASRRLQGLGQARPGKGELRSHRHRDDYRALGRHGPKRGNLRSHRHQDDYKALGRRGPKRGNLRSQSQSGTASPEARSTPFSVAASKAGQVAAQGFPARHWRARPEKEEPQEAEPKKAGRPRLRRSTQPHFESPQLRQVRQLSSMTLAFRWH